MPSPLSLLRCVGESMLRLGLRSLTGGLPLGDVLFELAGQVYQEWKQGRREGDLRAELQALAQASAQQVRREVLDIVADVAEGRPLEERQTLIGYLTQVPATLRQSLRRPSDPGGRTVPAALSLRGAEDLAPLLPTRLPRFRPGDRPSGVGDWELVEMLGVGGFGEVWKARNPHVEGVPPAALKFCLDPDARDRLLRHEAAILGQVLKHGRHPGIVQLRHTYLGADPPCLEYELVEGGDLTGLIREWHEKGRGPAPGEAAALVLRLAEIVGHVHALDPPIVHRDLKPANVLIPAGSRDLKIADFGIGGLAAGQELSRAGPGPSRRGQLFTEVARGACTPLYASPQQARGEPPDPRDDVHALGVIWYQLLTGDLAQGVPGGMAWVGELQARGMSRPLIDVLGACFEAKASNRPGSAGELARRIRAALGQAGRPASARPAAPAPEVEPVAPQRTAKPPPAPAGTPAPAAPAASSGFRQNAVALVAVVGLGLLGYCAWWYTEAWRSVATLKDLTHPVESVDLSPDGTQVACAASDGAGKSRAGIWSIETRKEVYSAASLGRVRQIVFLGGGRVFVADERGVTLREPAGDREVRAFRRREGERVGLLESWSHARTPPRLVCCFSLIQEASLRSGLGLVPASSSETVIWDSDSGEEIRVLRSTERWPSGVAISPDGQQVALGYYGSIEVCGVSPGRQTLSIDVGKDAPRGLAFSHDGSRLAGVVGEHVWVWDARTGETRLRIDAGRSLAFSPDDRWLAVGLSQGPVRVCEAASGRDVFHFTGHGSAVLGVAFSADGRRLASGSLDRTVRVWDVTGPR